MQSEEVWNPKQNWVRQTWGKQIWKKISKKQIFISDVIFKKFVTEKNKIKYSKRVITQFLCKVEIKISTSQVMTSSVCFWFGILVIDLYEIDESFPWNYKKIGE